MADAGQGARGGAIETTGPATAFPAGVMMASTWDTDLISRIGKAIGEEARNKGAGAMVLLGPGVNIHRSPLGGRNGEYFSEDPYLAARLGAAYIQGVQSTGVGACVKHFACNNLETDRSEVNEHVSERALREIYLPAFEAAVKEAKVWSVMTAYNKVNGLYCSANPYLLSGILKKDWNFDGLVMSDWGGVHETAAVQTGNDLEMPTGEHMSVPKLKEAITAGTVTQAAVDDSVRRILRTLIRVGLLDGPRVTDPKMVNSEEHRKLALEAATKGIVLLKNDGQILPLDRQKIKSIAVIGEPACHLQVGALGSAEVEPVRTVQLVDGIKAEAGSGISVRCLSAREEGEPITASVVTSPNDPNTRGFLAEYFANKNLEGKPRISRVEEEIYIPGAKSPSPGIGGEYPGIGQENFSVRWTGKLQAPVTGEYVFAFSGDDGFRVYLDGKCIIDHWVDGTFRGVTGTASLEAGKTYDLKVEFYQGGGDCMAELNWRIPGNQAYADVIEAAKNSDVAIVCLSTYRTEGENNDRPSMDLPRKQADLVRAVSAVNSNTIVVLNIGTPVTMKDWLPDVPALVEAWFPGQEGGTAVAKVLFGGVNPSGKLPDTFAVDRADYPDAPNPIKNKSVNYAEDIYVGYRHFDKTRIKPLFPFGFGLSYTTFKYSLLKVSESRPANGEITVSMNVKNTGKRAGEEIVQLYVHDMQPKIDRPERELKGFAKVALKPGETKKVQMGLTPRDFAYFDVSGHQWRAEAGGYEIEVGASSRDIRLKSQLKLRQEFAEKLPTSKGMQQANPVQNVNPFVGTGGHGHTRTEIRKM